MNGLPVRMRSAALWCTSLVIAFAVAAPGADGARWMGSQSPPTAAGGSDSTQEVIAALPDGTLVSAWQEKLAVGSGYAIVMWRRHTDGSYSNVDQLDTSPAPFTDLQLAADDAGNVIAIWCNGGL